MRKMRRCVNCSCVSINKSENLRITLLWETVTLRSEPVKCHSRPCGDFSARADPDWLLLPMQPLLDLPYPCRPWMVISPMQTLHGLLYPCRPCWAFSIRANPDWLLIPCWELPCNNLVPGAISHWVFSFQSLTGSAGIHQERAARNCLVRSKSNSRPAAQSGQGDVYLKTDAVCWGPL